MTAAYASAADLAGLPGFPVSERRAREAAARLGLPSRPRAARGGGLEYLVDALPDAARLALAARHLAANDAQSPASVPSARQARSTASNGVLVIGWQKDRQNAIARVLVLFQRFWQTYGGPLTPALKAFCHAWGGGLCAIEIPADDALRSAFPRLSFSSLRAWHLGVQERGLAAITPREHHRKGQFKALAGEVGNAVLALLIDRPHLSATQIYDAVSTQFSELPSERAFRRALAHWKSKNAQLFEAATNPDGWRNKFMSAAGSYSAGITAPNQKWEMDSTVGDVMLADGRRHHIVGVIDVFTRRRLFIVTRTSRANAIMALIRLAIKAWGVPQAIKTDNGADYTAHILESALLGLGIEHPLCHKFSPHEKPHIERAIGSLMHQLFETLDGYIGHSVAERKGIEARKGFAERIMKDETFTVEVRLTPEQLQSRIDAYCEHLLDKPRSYLGDRTPRQMAQGHAITTVPERALDVLLAASSKHGLRTVMKKGIRIDTGWFNHALLGGMEGQQVQAKVDESNLGRCWVFDLDGVFICEALDYTRLGINSAEVATARKARQAKVLRQQKRDLKALTRGFNTDAAIDAIHRERAEAAAAEPGNVLAFKPSPQVHSTPAITSIETAAKPVVDESRVVAAQAAVQERMTRPAEITPLHTTPQQRYARWLLLQARVERNEALTSEERNWFEGYAQGSEHGSMKGFFETFGLTPEQVLAG